MRSPNTSSEGSPLVSHELPGELKKPATLCAFCPKMCRHACPVSEAEGRESVTPWGKMSLLYMAQGREISLHEPPSRQALEACTGCGACVESCAHGNPVAESLFVARAASGSPRARAYREAFLATGDVKRRDFRSTLAAFADAREGPIAYYPGCARLAQGEAALRRDLEALRIATGREVPLVALPQGARCCGYPLYADGQTDVLSRSLPALLQEMRGFALIVTPDPGCAYLMSVVHDALAADAQRPHVVPLVEVLAASPERFAGRAAGLRVRYHDPCYLGRRGRSFDAPRRLIQAATGQPAMEFGENRERADCSGSGGLYPVSSPEGAREVARRRLEEDPRAHESGVAEGQAAAVVTACPSAARGFARAGARVLDIVELVLGGQAREEEHV